jgi:uncharacterized protein YaeQ
MALKATIFKAAVQVADVERGYYAGHALTLARHPSETDERMMVRLLAFALNAHEHLGFGAGLSSDEEPHLSLADLTGEIQLWIEVGLPDEKRVRRACGRARRVVVYSYGRGAAKWWEEVGDSVSRSANLRVVELPEAATRELAALAQRNMALDCTVNDGQAWVSDGARSVHIEPLVRKQ